MDNQICQLGLVAPMQGFLEQNSPVIKGPNTAYMLRGCLKSSMLDKFHFFKYYILFVKFQSKLIPSSWIFTYNGFTFQLLVLLFFGKLFHFMSTFYDIINQLFVSSFLIMINWFQFGICTLTCMHSGFSMMMNCLTALIQTWLE